MESRHWQSDRSRYNAVASHFAQRKAAVLCAAKLSCSASYAYLLFVTLCKFRTMKYM